MELFGGSCRHRSGQRTLKKPQQQHHQKKQVSQSKISSKALGQEACKVRQKKELTGERVQSSDGSDDGYAVNRRSFAAAVSHVTKAVSAQMRRPQRESGASPIVGRRRCLVNSFDAAVPPSFPPSLFYLLLYEFNLLFPAHYH